MCWSITLPTGKPLEPKEAEQNISVFKVLEITHQNGMWIALEGSQVYQSGKTEKMEKVLEAEKEPDGPYHIKWTIRDGYRSYAPGELKVVKAEPGDTYPEDLKLYHHGIKEYSLNEQGIARYVAMECVIPKGATYYYDDWHKEYVSDELLVTGVSVPLWRFRV